MTARELQDKMLAHIEVVREFNTAPNGPPDGQPGLRSVLRHLDGEALLRVEQFVRSFKTEG